MHSIRFQSFAFIAAVLIILLLLLNTYPLTSARDLVFQEKKSSLSAQASVIAASLSNLDRLESKSVGEVVRVLEVQGLSRLMVVDAAGTVLYDDGGGTGYVTDVADVFTALSGKTAYRSEFAGSAFSSSYAMPVSTQRAVSGAVYLCEYDSERAEIILDIQSRIRYVSITIVIAALILAAAFSQLLFRRLQELIRSMRIVATGDYGHRVATRGQDEITELGNEFNQLTERLDDNERQRRRFVSDASHELKTPLASIRLMSDSIVQSSGMDAETMREFAADIGHEAQRLQRTTEKLLDLSRLDDDVQILPEPVDVKQVCVDALVTLKPLADEKGVRIRCDLEDGCVVMATADDMYHIIFNLMENAVKYNVPDGCVTVTLRSGEEKISLTVADTGIGIPEEDRLNIFSRFYRVDKARSREAGGSGLGLSIVHDAVQAHGGSIAVGQNKPRGSIFIVSFPRPTSEETGI